MKIIAIFKADIADVHSRMANIPDVSPSYYVAGDLLPKQHQHHKVTP